MINILEGYLLRIRQYARMSKLAIMFSTPILLYGQVSANPQTSVVRQFDPISVYCKQLIDPTKPPLSLSDVISRSGLPYEERQILKIHL
mgnify:FL=1